MIKSLFRKPAVYCFLFPILLAAIFIQEHYVYNGFYFPTWRRGDLFLFPLSVAFVNTIPLIFLLIYYKNPIKALGLFIKISSGILIALFCFMLLGLHGTSLVIEMIDNDIPSSNMILTPEGQFYYGCVFAVMLLSIRKLYKLFKTDYS